MRWVVLALTCGGFWLAAAAVRAEADTPAPPSDAAVRESVQRALPYLQREGLAWIEERDCNSCHVVPFMLWSFHSARDRGLDVDEKALAAWDARALRMSLDLRVWYKLSPAAVEQLRAASLPEGVLGKLGPLVDRPFTSRTAWQAALREVLDPADFAAHAATIEARAAQPKKGALNDGGGLDTVAQLLLGTALASQTPEARQYRAEMPAFAARWQEPDGRWKAAGQQNSRRWNKDVAEADQTTTMFAVLALDDYADTGGPSTQPLVRAALDKALAYLRQQQPGSGHEWLVARLLMAARFEDADAVARWRTDLLGRQNADGGWGWLPGEASEPMSTGEALYALARVGVGDSGGGVARGRAYLLAAQAKTDTWWTPPAAVSGPQGGEARHKRLGPIYEYWGTAWAVLGLVETLPRAEPPNRVSVAPRP